MIATRSWKLYSAMGSSSDRTLIVLTCAASSFGRQ